MATRNPHSRAVFPSLRATGALALFVLALPLAAGCRRSSAEQTVAQKAEPPAISVKLVPAQPMAVARVLTLSGTLIGSEEAKVAAGATGKVISTHVERGSFVKKGAILARLDARVPSAQAQEAAAQLESLKLQQVQAKLDCDRTQQMLEKGAISKADFDRAQTQCATSKWSVSAAEARKALAGDALEDTEIRAPFAGMVVERLISPGEFVRPDAPVVTLVAVDALRVELTVPEAEVAHIRPGLPVEFRVAADTTGAPRRGKIRYVGPAVRQQTRDAIVEAVVENPGHDLRPGMFVTARVPLGQQTLPSVPASAVRSDGPQHHVFVVVGGRLEDRLVQLGESNDGRAVIVGGLKAGEQVVAELTADLRDGAKVK